MPWAPPDWCAAPASGDVKATVTLQSQKGQPRRYDISGKAFFLLKRELQDPDGSQDDCSSWHAVVLRDKEGKCFIMDLESSTGTFMDGKRLEPKTPYDLEANKVVVLGVPPLHVKVTLERPPQAHGVKRQHSESQEAKPLQPPKEAKRQRCQADAPAAGVGSSSSSKSSSTGSTSTATKCDKCDGPHPTDRCPHFRKKREDHKDAWVNYGRKSPLVMGRSGGKLIVKRGRMVPQPGDGSCLFHSLCFGLNGGRSSGRFVANQLRRELAQFVQRNPRMEISGDTIEEWVRWDANSSVSAYARRMATGGWGGGIEMAVCSLLKKVNVHVYERKRGGSFERISCFDSPERTKTTIHVLYQGGVHYDAFVPCQ